MATTMTTAASVLEEESALTSGTGLRRAGAICALLQVAMLAVMFAIFLGAAPALSFDALGRDPAASVTALRRGAGVYVPLADFMVIAAATLGIVVLALRAQFLQRRSDLISVGSLFGFFAALTLLVGNGLIVTLVSWAQRLPSDVVERGVPAVLVGMSTTLGIGLFTLGLWIGVLSLVALRNGGLPAWLGYLGLLTTLADVAILVGPPLGLFPTLVWFLAAAAVLFGTAPTPVRAAETAS